MQLQRGAASAARRHEPAASTAAASRLLLAAAASQRPRSRFGPGFFASPIVLPIESTISRHLSVGGEGSEKLDVHRKAHGCCAPRAGQVRQVRARRAPLDSFAHHARVRARRPRARFWPEVTGPRSRGLGSRDRHAWARFHRWQSSLFQTKANSRETSCNPFSCARRMQKAGVAERKPQSFGAARMPLTRRTREWPIQAYKCNVVSLSRCVSENVC